MPDSPKTDWPETARLVAEPIPGDNALALSVSELSQRLKRTVEGEFGHVRLRGEISGFKRVASGHCYLCLKDEDAVIDAVIWRGSAGALAFRPEDGAEVIATGRLTTYPGRSKYQIVVDRMELAGAGALMALLERRKAALAAEGAGLRSRGYALLDDVPPQERIADRLAIRGSALELLNRSAAALIAAGAGPSMLLSNPAQRLAREALFHLVQASTPAMREAVLHRLADRGVASAGRAD